MGKINWLASYPKSGNTWIRVFLTNLIQHKTGLANINALLPSTIASSRNLIDNQLGIDTSLLTDVEIEELRPLAYEALSDSYQEVQFHKIHDAYTFSADSKPLIPPICTNKALYLVRNPLDIAISMANHMNYSIDAAINDLNNSEFCLNKSKKTGHRQVKQRLLTWSEHVKSWTKQTTFEVLTVKYEDLLFNPILHFNLICTFFQLSYSEEDLILAIEKSKIQSLQEQEKEQGFTEKNPGSDLFFRKGIKDEWQNVLSPEQVEKIVTAHYKVMDLFHYLPN
jgi:hypothetical protein